MKQTTTAFLLTVLVGLSAACGGPTKSTAPPEPVEPPAESADSDGLLVVTPDLSELVIPATPVAAPVDLMAEVVFRNPNQQMTQIATFADAVQPGLGASVTPQMLMQMLEGMVGAVGIAGLDLNSPMFVAILDGERFVVIATVTSEADLMESLSTGNTRAVTHDGFAAIGKADALMDVAPYGLSNLVKQPIPEKPTFSLHIGKILSGTHGEEVRADIRKNIDSDGSNAMAADVVIDTLSNVEVLHTSLDANPNAATFVLQAIVKPGPLKEFVGKQGPSDFSAVGRIGTGPWAILAGGRLDLSQFAPILTKMVAAENNPVLTQLTAQVANLSGEMAFAVNMPQKPELVLAMQVAEPDALAEIVDGIVALAATQRNMDFGGMPGNLKPSALKTRGGSLHELKLQPTTDSHKDLYGKKSVSAFFGVATGSLIATFGSNAKKYANVLVTAKGKIAGKGKRLAAAVDGAQAAGESLVLAMDVLSLQGGRGPLDVEPLVIGIGFAESSVTARVVVPTDFFKEAAARGGIF